MAALIVLAGCAPRGPWPFSTEAQRERLLLREGMTVAECTAKKGDPIAGPNYNPAAAGYHVAPPPPDFSGTAYYGIDGSISCEEVFFGTGKIVSIKYVRNPWAGYDTWQRHELSWDKR